MPTRHHTANYNNHHCADLRPSPEQTPHINGLSMGATTFTLAFAQQAVCGPSRNSFLSGRRPDKTKTWTFQESFRDIGPQWQSLPQFFKDEGYFVCGVDALSEGGGIGLLDGVHTTRTY